MFQEFKPNNIPELFSTILNMHQKGGVCFKNIFENLTFHESMKNGQNKWYNSDGKWGICTELFAFKINLSSKYMIQ